MAFEMRDAAQQDCLCVTLEFGNQKFCSCRHKYYWWESSLLLRNLLLVAVVYLGPALGVYIQAHIVLLIMIVSLVLHAYTRPFKEPIIDNMEFVSIGNAPDIAVFCVQELSYE